MLGSLKTFRDEYLIFAYGKEGIGEGRDKNNTISKKKKEFAKAIQNDWLVQIMNL